MLTREKREAIADFVDDLASNGASASSIYDEMFWVADDQDRGEALAIVSSRTQD